MHGVLRKQMLQGLQRNNNDGLRKRNAGKARSEEHKLLALLDSREIRDIRGRHRPHLLGRRVIVATDT